MVVSNDKASRSAAHWPRDQIARYIRNHSSLAVPAQFRRVIIIVFPLLHAVVSINGHCLILSGGPPEACGMCGRTLGVGPRGSESDIMLRLWPGRTRTCGSLSLPAVSPPVAPLLLIILRHSPASYTPAPSIGRPAQCPLRPARRPSAPRRPWSAPPHRRPGHARLLHALDIAPSPPRFARPQPPPGPGPAPHRPSRDFAPLPACVTSAAHVSAPR